MKITLTGKQVDIGDRLRKHVEENIENHLIIRLPAIYGINLKKNFLYDYIHRIPSMLTESKYLELSANERLLQQYYINQGNGFYKCKHISIQEESVLQKCFSRLGFSALNFTDSRSFYQFYWLKNLWKDITIALQYGVMKLNMVPPPIQVSKLFEKLEGKLFCNTLNKPPFNYDLRTKHSHIFGRTDGYIMDRAQAFADINVFLKAENKNRGI